jgi:hypothetical protein
MMSFVIYSAVETHFFTVLMLSTLQENWFEMQLNMKEYRKSGEQYLVDAFTDQAFRVRYKQLADV